MEPTASVINYAPVIDLVVLTSEEELSLALQNVHPDASTRLLLVEDLAYRPQPGAMRVA